MVEEQRWIPTPNSSLLPAKCKVEQCKWHQTMAAVISELVVGTMESSMLHLWTCSVVTSSHVAWKDPEMVVVCIWPLISLMILCTSDTKRKVLSASELVVYINYRHTPSVSVGKSLCSSQPVKSWNEKSVFVTAFSPVIFSVYWN